MAVARAVALWDLWRLTSRGYESATVLYAVSIVTDSIVVSTGNAGALLQAPITGVTVPYLYSVREVFGTSDRAIPDDPAASATGHTHRRGPR